MTQSPAATPITHADIPLVVDLDGTLIRSDVLYESLVRLLRSNPLHLLRLPLWLFRGRANLKRQIAQRVHVDVSTLPYRTELLTYLADESRRGRRLVLATTTDALMANEIASYLGIFSTVVASDGTRNLKGHAKAAELGTLFGDRPFAYAGNEWADVPVWRAARAGVLISADRRLAEHVATMTSLEMLLRPTTPGLRQLASAARLAQWVKNLLVFVPLAAAHRLTELPLLGHAVIAFVAFGLVASAGYMVNDLIDVEADRNHERKRERPFASGALDFRIGLAAIPVLVLTGIGIGALSSWALALTLLGYFAATQLYTFALKRIALVDVFVLAVLYAARIVAGAIAVGVPISQWLVAFSVFFFLCLAFVKRYSELHALRALESEHAEGRGYLIADFDILSTLGAASGYIAVLVLALYINSEEVTVLYRTPDALWLVCLVLLYWISRVWIIAHRGHMDDDPIVFALKDRTSYLAGAVCAAAVLAAWI